MKQQNRRSTNTPSPLFSNIQSIDDAELVKRVIALPIDDDLRAELVALDGKLKPGRFGVMRKGLRDRIIKIARAGGAIQKCTRPKGIKTPLKAPDHYMDGVSEGTSLAEAIIAWQCPSLGGTMPVPPGKRSA